MTEKVLVIDLQRHEFECHVCGTHGSAPPSGPSYGIPIYEGVIVPDDYKGEWGGVPVCSRCYYVVRGIQSEHPGHTLEIAAVRRLANGCDA